MSIILLEDSTEEIIEKLSEGKPGAIEALKAILSEGDKIYSDSYMGPVGHILRFDGYGVSGSKIEYLYKTVCNKSVSMVIALIKASQLNIISTYEFIKACSGLEMLDLDGIYNQVCEKLPEFDKENRDK